MRLCHKALCFVFSLAALCEGVVLAAFPMNRCYDFLATHLPDVPYLRIGVGVGLALLGLLGLLGSGLFRRKSKKISFSSPQGNTVVQLEPIEASLTRALSRLPEIRKIALTLTPAENGRIACVNATVRLNKAGGTGVREAGDRLAETIAAQAKRLLGVDEVGTVDLTVRGIHVSDDGAEPLDLVDTPAPPPFQEREPIPARNAYPSEFAEPSDSEATWREPAHPLPGLIDDDDEPADPVYAEDLGQKDSSGDPELDDSEQTPLPDDDPDDREDPPRV